MDKIAILTDSGTDVPHEFSDKYPIYTVPLQLNYEHASYRENVDITPEQVVEHLDIEIPRTSAPTPADVEQTLSRIISEGFTHIIAVHISSKLTSTQDIVHAVSAGHPELITEIVDTGSLGIGAGLTVIRAAELVASGISFKDAVARARKAAWETTVFFIIDTLEYLYRGGRINKAIYSIGSILNIHPIIDLTGHKGVLDLAGKARSRQQAIKKAIAAAKKAVDDARVRIAYANVACSEEAEKVALKLKETFDTESLINAGHLSSVLSSHSGPGLIGFALQKI